MGMDELIATLEREAEARCSAAREAARREAERIRRAADERLERRRAEAAAELEAELAEREEGALAEARTAVRGARLRARRRALERVFRRARELLPAALEEPAYVRSLPRSLVDALACLADDRVEIACPPALAPALRRAAAAAEVGSRVEIVGSEEAAAGFLARGARTGVRVDATLATRLETARPELELVVLPRLEAASSAEPGGTV